MQRQGMVSCRHVRWLFEVCRRRRIPERHLLNHAGLSRDEILDPVAMIEWEIVALIYANLGSWLTNDELVEEGESAWRHPDFKSWLMTAALFAEPREQVLSLLDEASGLLASLPMSATVSEPEPDNLIIEIRTTHDAPPSLVFLRVLAGQLAGLPSRLGADSADVRVSQTEHGARLELWLPQAGWFSGLRRRFMLPFRALAVSDHFRRLFDALLAREQSLADTERQSQRSQEALERAKDVLAESQAELADLMAKNEGLEQEAARHRSDLHTLLAAVQEAVVTTDEHGRIVEFNGATIDIFGFDDDFLRGASITTLIPGANHLRANDGVASLAGTTRRGDELQLQVTALPSGSRETSWVVRDMTELDQADKERAALQHQLQAAQRVESLGELTGGIAHDFNNLLVAINGYAELGLDTPDLDETITEYLKEIRGAGERAADLTQKLLTFARQQDIQTTQVDLNELIRGVERIIRRLLPVNINVRFLQSLQSPFVTADAGQLEQVVINLCVNARDAMPDGGQLTIAVGQKEAVNPDASRTEVATITIEDTGMGIPQEIAGRIFEPFFTTKDKGEGTGLGLSVVFGIIKRHGGTIDVDSDRERGTRFLVSLPLTDPLRNEVTEAESPSRRYQQVQSRAETILLIEDNHQVRELCERVLRRRGYNVMTAIDGGEGVRQFEHNSRNIDLVIADVVMPKLGGQEVFERIRAARPDMKMLFSTGYASDSEQTRFIAENGLDVIEKPYTPESLCDRVRRVLDAD